MPDRGGFSVVHRARRIEDGLICAVKVVRLETLTEHERQKLYREAEITARMRHENVVRMFEMFSTPEVRRPVAVAADQAPCAH